MKKALLLVGAVLLLASCGSRWSCKKRYCDVKTQQTEILKAENTTALAQP